MKIKQNWAVSYNQKSKPNSESKSPIYSTVVQCTVIGSNCKRAIEGKHVKKNRLSDQVTLTGKK